MMLRYLGMRPAAWLCFIGLYGFLQHSFLNFSVSAKLQPNPNSSISNAKHNRKIQMVFKNNTSSVDIFVTGLPANVRLFTTKVSNGYQIIAEGPDLLHISPTNATELITDDQLIKSVRLDVSDKQVKFLIATSSPQPPSISSTGSQLIFSFPQSSLPQYKTLQRQLEVDSPALRPYTSSPSRLIAPALGQISSGILPIPNPGMINLTGPTITINAINLNAITILDYIAKRGGYDIVFVKSDPTSSVPSQSATVSTQAPNTPTGISSSNASSSASQSSSDAARLVSLSLRSKPYSSAFNSVLLASGLQATYRSGIIYVGPDLVKKVIGERISKTYRLNQVSVDSAAKFLANLGASMTETQTLSQSVTTGVSSQSSVASGSTSNTTTTQSESKVLTYGANVGPLLGLSGTTDPRLRQITVVGEDKLVDLAGEYLRRLDLRTRQVALTIKIYDVDLTNNLALSNQLSYADGKVILTSDPSRGNVGVVFNRPSQAQILRRPQAPGFAPINPLMSGSTASVTQVGSDAATITAPTGIYAEGQDQVLYDTFTALETSKASKLLASPTILLMETNTTAGGASGSQQGPNEANIFIGENVITGLEPIPNTTSCKQIFTQVGLKLRTKLELIDDNGYVGFVIDPSLTAPAGKVPVTTCGNQTIELTAERTLKSGYSRVRDGQTLIITGVLSEKESTVATKVPILGDLPLFGSLFRQTNTDRKKSELVITVTPRILNDAKQEFYGYYEPSVDVRRSIEK